MANTRPIKQTKKKRATAARPVTRAPKRVAETKTVYKPHTRKKPTVEPDSLPLTPRPVPDILKRDYKTLTTREEKMAWFKALAELEPETPRFHGVIYVDDVEVWRGQEIEKKYDELRAKYPDRKIALSWVDTAPIVIYSPIVVAQW